ncbi:spermidine synthase [uncultured Schumannella sp.]|uniref:spermidine synthase n=1 Tax=uncultured Schumannella sp. TaxID=1195956 RepID=UPI0025D94256|nr:spermidine synthase [uncultured Schumannella sp.]
MARIGFEELDFQNTPMGEISLRRRHDPHLGVEVFEVKLNDEYLMSSLFTVAEEELATLGLAAVEGDALDVLVGGLGLGYTAVTALADERVRALTVVDALAEVVGWHERRLLPVSNTLLDDARTSLVVDDFFDLARREPVDEASKFHAILVDIDHTPTHRLDSTHADFYTADGLRSLARHLHPGGVFALWSDDPPETEFLAVLAEVFPQVSGELVSFDNPLTGGVSTNSVYVAKL